MKPTAPSLALALTLPLLALLLTACAPLRPRPPAAVSLPALPAQARQTALPSWCSPSCSAALQGELSSWQRQLTQPTPPAQPASAPTGR